ncbi:zinc finger domain-containing protein [Corynebacterium dentalis]|uniref:zinc finger domain-containing protein n=1 Tax=Corynebacterium dentalis TaxID=2014528 RepID=UPI0035E3BEC5
MSVEGPESRREMLPDQRKRHLRRLSVFQCIYHGKLGYFSRSLNVYGREGRPCLRCETPIQRVVVGGRSSHFCPECQR